MPPCTHCFRFAHPPPYVGGGGALATAVVQAEGCVCPASSLQVGNTGPVQEFNIQVDPGKAMVHLFEAVKDH